jgi:dipeptidase
MCDCAVVTRGASATGATIFAKNSDREPDEHQLLEIADAAEHAPGAVLSCTYVDVPQVARTHRVLLSRPSWMWGAEIALNDQGLAVGNEAVFTRLPGGSFLRPDGGRGLTGMDLVRLVSERAGSAEEGVTVLTELLATHGQGGPGGYHDKSFTYHNSFLLADPEDAWVVETAGVFWAAKRVTEGVRAISNALTLGDDYDQATPGLEALARDLGVHRGKGRVNFAAAFSDRALGFASAATERRSCLEAHLRAARPATVTDAFAGLRSHASGVFRNLRASVCAHASWLPTRAACQTTSSLVGHLDARGPVAFVTGTSSPCVSSFKPVWLDTGLEGYTSALWWEHYAEMRARDLGAWRTAIERRRNAKERALVEQALALEPTEETAAKRRALTAEAFGAAPTTRAERPRAAALG